LACEGDCINDTAAFHSLFGRGFPEPFWGQWASGVEKAGISVKSRIFLHHQLLLQPGHGHMGGETLNQVAPTTQPGDTTQWSGSSPTTTDISYVTGSVGLWGTGPSLWRARLRGIQCGAHTGHSCQSCPGRQEMGQPLWVAGHQLWRRLYVLKASSSGSSRRMGLYCWPSTLHGSGVGPKVWFFNSSPDTVMYVWKQSESRYWEQLMPARLSAVCVCPQASQSGRLAHRAYADHLLHQT
jgi:hypothetical protein